MALQNKFINDKDAYNNVLHFVQQNVSSVKSPWVSNVNGRKGRRLALRQNPFSLQRTEKGPGYSFVRSPKYPNKGYKDLHYSSVSCLSGLVGNGATAWSPSISEMNTAVSKWYNKAAGFSMNVSEIYATRKQTIDMVTSTINRIANAIGLLARKKYKAAFTTLGITYKRPKRGTNPAQLWLEMQYGWLPLMSDVYTLINKPWPNVYSVITSRHTVNNNRTIPGSISGYTNAQWTEMSEGHITVRGKVTVLATALAAASQMGVSNPLSLGWELLPFSFVVDWFLPVGSYLESLTALGGCAVTESSVTRSWTTTSTGTGVIPEDSTHYAGMFAATQVFHKKDRTLGIPNRPFPTLKNPLSTHHLSLALSLLATNTRSAARF